MSEMTPIQRMQAVADGRRPDRPPVSFWYHFPPARQTGPAAVDAHVRHLRRYKLDFLKIMNDHEYPTRRVVHRASDLRDLPVLNGDEAEFGCQLDLIRALAATLKGEVYLITTIFNAWAVLRRIVTPRNTKVHHPPVMQAGVDPVEARLTELLVEDRGAVGMAIDAIAASLANFAKRCFDAGADGIFLSVRDDWVSSDANGANTYNELVRLGDGQIITAARGGRFNMLHVCGVPRDFDAFAAYPVHAINWADRSAGPSIASVVGRIKPAICGGVDNLSTLPDGTPEAVETEVRDALRQAGDHPMIVSAGCTFDPDSVACANLEAIVRAARAWSGSDDV